MSTNQEIIQKYKNYSTSQLELLVTRVKEDDKREAIESILAERRAKKGGTPTKETPKETETPTKEKSESKPKVEKPKVEKPKKEKKEKAPAKVRKEASTAVIRSEDSELNSKIQELPTLVGEALEERKSFLKENGIDVEFIPFLAKGDLVEFEAANNSPEKGKIFKGYVLNVNDLDKAGRRYCRVKVEGFGTFQKSQISVKRLENAKQ